MQIPSKRAMNSSLVKVSHSAEEKKHWEESEKGGPDEVKYEVSSKWKWLKGESIYKMFPQRGKLKNNCQKCHLWKCESGNYTPNLVSIPPNCHSKIKFNTWAWPITLCRYLFFLFAHSLFVSPACLTCTVTFPAFFSSLCMSGPFCCLWACPFSLVCFSVSNPYFHPL